jgi:hypothetical protein
MLRHVHSRIRLFQLLLTFIGRGLSISAQPSVTLSYLGTAGWEITDGKTVVLIDPYISRLKTVTPNDLVLDDDPRPLFTLTDKSSKWHASTNPARDDSSRRLWNSFRQSALALCLDKKRAAEGTCHRQGRSDPQYRSIPHNERFADGFASVRICRLNCRKFGSLRINLAAEFG